MTYEVCYEYLLLLPLRFMGLLRKYHWKALLTLVMISWRIETTFEVIFEI